MAGHRLSRQKDGTLIVAYIDAKNDFSFDYPMPPITSWVQTDVDGFNTECALGWTAVGHTGILPAILILPTIVAPPSV